MEISTPINNIFHLIDEEFIMTKELMSNLKIVGQIDRKFIATSLCMNDKRYLVLWDQHAADERIQLELLQSKFKSGSPIGHLEKIQEPLTVIVHLKELVPKDKLLVNLGRNFEKHLSSSGIICSTKQCGDRFFISITAFPLASLQKILPNRNAEHYLNYVKDSVRRIALSYFRDPRKTRQTFLQHLMATEACGRAIKFGKTLTHSTMTHILKRLTVCDLPFQCAHGRPTLTIIKYCSRKQI